MKIIGVLPIKNESAFIETYMSSVDQVCDKVIVLDDSSTDNSVEILSKNNKFEVITIDNDNNWSTKRAALFDVARQNSATHIISLDADEAFTHSFIENFDTIVNQTKPGFRYTFQWLAMWKSYTQYRQDYSVWSNSFKDFLFHDDGKLEYSGSWIHEPRFPNTNNVTQFPTNMGAVFHFQFSCWDAFQIKQSWYRCLERVKNPNKHPQQINLTYSITLDDNNVNTVQAPELWYKNIKMPNDNDIYKNSLWRIDDIKKWFEEYGIEYFSGLNIWHVKEINDLKNGI